MATCHGDPSLTEWGPNFFLVEVGSWRALWPHAIGTQVCQNGDPIFSEMGTLASRMGTQKAHVFKIDGNKLICRNKGRKKMIFRVWRHLMHTDCYIFIK